MNKNLLHIIEQEYPTMSKTHRVIADIIFDNEIDKTNLTITEFSKMAFCSPSTILKFINLFNYKSYRVFLNDLSKENNLQDNSITSSFLLVDNIFNEQDSIIDTLISDINDAQNVYIFSSGLSKLPAYDFIYKCKYYDKNKFIDAHSELKYITTITKNDLVIFISNSGESKPLSVIAKKINTTSYLITNRENSIIGKSTSHVININNNIEQPNNFSLFPKESKYSLMYFFDLLFSKMY